MQIGGKLTVCGLVRVLTWTAPAAAPVGALVRQPEEAPRERVMGGQPQERVHVQYGGGLLVVRGFGSDAVDHGGGQGAHWLACVMRTAASTTTS
jgi:hypothetical protein